MNRFAAQQPGGDGNPLYYLVEYEMSEQEETLFYFGRAYITNDFNRQITADDEAFSYSFNRVKGQWSEVKNIKVESGLGPEMAEKVKHSFFNDLILSGTMGFEEKNGI